MAEARAAYERAIELSGTPGSARSWSDGLPRLPPARAEPGRCGRRALDPAEEATAGQWQLPLPLSLKPPGVSATNLHP